MDHLIKTGAIAAIAATVFWAGTPMQAQGQTCPQTSVAAIGTSEDADAYLAARFDGLAAPSLPVFEVRNWLGCDGQEAAQSRALALASPQKVAEIADILLTGEAAAAMRKSVTAEDAKGLFGLLFHPAFMAHLSMAEPDVVAGWDALAEALEAAYEGPASVAPMGASARRS